MSGKKGITAERQVRRDARPMDVRLFRDDFCRAQLRYRLAEHPDVVGMANAGLALCDALEKAWADRDALVVNLGEMNIEIACQDNRLAEIRDTLAAYLAEGSAGHNMEEK